MRKLKIGDTVKGFYYNNFRVSRDGFYLNYLPKMNEFIGKMGIIIAILGNKKVEVRFKDVSYWYPTHLIKINKIQHKLK